MLGKAFIQSKTVGPAWPKLGLPSTAAVCPAISVRAAASFPHHSVQLYARRETPFCNQMLPLSQVLATVICDFVTSCHCHHYLPSGGFDKGLCFLLT